MFFSEEKTIIELPFVGSLLFAGSPNAARSALSTIAMGWATILGVAFSVTLISLQLSVTKHTPEIANQFENDKVNQITLGWFIATVVYSMLVLKTVRTGDDGSDPFTPVIGVNVAVLFAIVGFFIFVAFVNNVSSYLKANLLIDRIVKQILTSIKKLENRKIDKRALFDKDKIPKKEVMFQVRAPQSGVLRLINWQRMAKLLTLKQNFSSKEVWIEWSAEVGSWIEKDRLIATVYCKRAEKQ